MQKIDKGQAAEKLGGLWQSQDDGLYLATRYFADLLAEKVAARANGEFTPMALMIECSEWLTKLDNGQARTDAVVLQELWPEHGADVKQQIRLLTKVVFGGEFAAEFDKVWPQELDEKKIA
jgi:hypothetical protein